MMGIESLQEIFRDIFGKSELKLTPDLDATKVDTWDSFNHINLIVAIEDAYSTTFTTSEISSMTYVDDLVRLLRQRGHTLEW